MPIGIVGIIDWHDERRLAMRAWVAQKGLAVKDAINRSAFGELNNIDLLLLHIGESQRKEGDNLELIVQEASRCSLVLAYSGSRTSVRKFQQVAASGFAVFPEAVSGDTFDEDLKRVLAKVLYKLPSRDSLSLDWFTETVTGFNPQLELQLEVLIQVLGGREPSEEDLKAASAGISLNARDRLTSQEYSESLRKAFFGS